LPFNVRPVVTGDAVRQRYYKMHPMHVDVKQANQFILKKRAKQKTCQIAAMRFPQG
jgi:hypothetical protein